MASSLKFRISVCARDEVPAIAGRGITHLLSIDKPDEPTPTPEVYDGVHWHVQFDDIVSQAEAEEFDATLPEIEDIRQVLDYADCCLQSSHTQPVHLLVHCQAGISRSTAAAYAMVSQMLGEGREQDALEHLFDIRPEASPNKLVVKHADAILNRNGKLLEALESLQRERDRDDNAAATGQGNDE